MSKINEVSKWEEGVYQIKRGDEVSGGRNGVANIQAEQLANRTRFLKSFVESLSDAQDLTFRKTESDPDGTISGLAGSALGQFFRVAQGEDDYSGFIYYLNDAGSAIPVANIPGMAALHEIISRVFWSDDEHNAFKYKDSKNNVSVRIRKSGEFQAAKARLFSALANEIAIEKLLLKPDPRGVLLRFVDAIGRTAIRVKKSGEFEAASLRALNARLIDTVADNIDIRRLPLTPDEKGVLWRIKDQKGRDAVRLMKNGRFLFVPNLKVFNDKELVSDRVGSIRLGKGLAATKTATGVRIESTQNTGGSGPLGRLASNFQEPVKLNDRESWGDRTLILQAGRAMLPGNSGSDTIFGPWVIPTDRIPAAQRVNGAKYYMYYSTDHAWPVGGCFMATADDVLGPWTPYGLVYSDPSSNQTETPCVRWDGAMQRWFMTYHVYNAKYGPNDSIAAVDAQNTLGAYSYDGVNWTKDQNFVLEKGRRNVGDGHTGYFYMYDTPAGLIARSAMNGGWNGLNGIWRHRGGTLGGQNINGVICNNWFNDYRDVGSGYDLTYGTEHHGLRCVPFGAFGYSVNGVKMAVGQLWNRRSGLDPAKVSIVAGPVTDDYTKFNGMPSVIWTPEREWESNDIRFTTCFVDKDFIYIFLVMNITNNPEHGANVVGAIRHAI